MTSEEQQKVIEKPSIQLILYRIGEMSGKIDGMGLRIDAYQKDTNDKISNIEKDLAVSKALALRDEEDKQSSPQIDVQKIVLAALSLVSTVVAIALGVGRTNLPK